MTGENVGDVTGELDVVVSEFAALDVIKTKLLLLGSHAERQAGHEVEQEANEGRHDERPGAAGDGLGKLVTKLNEVTVDPATVNGVVLSSKLGNPGTGIESQNTDQNA